MSRKIFISYRRSDTSDFTVALYQQLRNYFADDDVFKDINGIEPGMDFADALKANLDSCLVMLVVIGPKWKGEGHNRLMDETDWVRIEVAHALANRIRVVPVLVNGASMPTAAELPHELQPLRTRQALLVDNQRFEYDVDRLCLAIKDLVPIVKGSKRDASTIWDNAFKIILLMVMLASLGIMVWALVGFQGEFREEVFMALLGGGGLAGAGAVFTRQRWIELRSNQIEKK